MLIIVVLRKRMIRSMTYYGGRKDVRTKSNQLMIERGE